MRPLVLVLVGCVGSAPGTPTVRTAICRAGDAAVDATLFDRLTATRWSGASYDLTLHASGSYEWRESFGDYILEGEGRWNFLARDATSGLACFDNGAITDFAFGAGGLTWNTDGLLAPGEALPADGTRAALDEIAPNQLFLDLTRHPWQRTNEFDLFFRPTTFTMRDDGTFDAAWRYGACTGAGTFSITALERFGDPIRYELTTHTVPNQCDTRLGGITATIGDLLDYRDAAIMTDERSLHFDSYGQPDYGLLVGATWTGATRGTKTWQMTAENQTSRAQALTNIEITLTPVEPSADGNGYSALGPAVVLFQRALANTLAPHATHELTADLAFPTSGLHSLEIEIDSADDRQSYTNRRSYLLELTP